MIIGESDAPENNGPCQNDKTGVSVDQERKVCPGSLKQAGSLP